MAFSGGSARALSALPEPHSAHHRAHVWQAEREPPDRDTLRQACEKLCRYGLASLFHALFGTSLLVQSLDSCDWLLLAESSRS